MTKRAIDYNVRKSKNSYARYYHFLCGSADEMLCNGNWLVQSSVSLAKI